MNKQLKKRWVEALRSGQYKQGQGVLRNDNNQFCCLGVLCDLVAPDSWTDDVVIQAIGSHRNAIRHKGHIGFPDDEIINEIFGSGSVVRESLSSLAAANDSGITFAEIASRIEANALL